MQALGDSRDPLAHGQTLVCSWAPAEKQGLPGTRADSSLPREPHFRTSQEPGKLPFRSLRLTTDTCRTREQKDRHPKPMTLGVQV